MTPGAGPSARPPPLPARDSQSVLNNADTELPPSYQSAQEQKFLYYANQEQSDPRSTSQESLAPEPGEQNERRKLLLIYVHGFMGNEMSFRSFPAHVHNLLSVLLAESHVVHTKVYPRYRSKRSISFARDDFSKWLTPHEDPLTDIVLLGHSMGGLLAAEIVLATPLPPSARPLKHRILGTINFDVPFLGMHPGIVRSGLASIFKPSEETHVDKWTPESEDVFWSRNDPNYNPAYPNDVKLPVRKGWSNAWHFVSKHSDNLTKATKQLVSSHVEFGGAMANLSELKNRYVRVRSLEEQNEAVRNSVVQGADVPRVRFINYYTASHGRPKLPSKQGENEDKSEGDGLRDQPSKSGEETGVTASGQPDEDAEPSKDAPIMTNLEHIEPTPIALDQDEAESEHVEGPKAHATSESSLLPPLPELPKAPPPLDVSYIEDKEMRKLVEKEHARAQRAYEKAVTDREKVLRERAQLEEKQRKRKEKEKREAETKAKKSKPESEMSHSEREELRLEQERQRMEAEARRLRGEKRPEKAAKSPSESHEDLSRAASNLSITSSSVAGPTLSQPSRVSSNQRPVTDKRKESKGPPKDRKFCNLPPKDANGERDPCWVRVFMEGVDEVGAHCGLFFIDERYERMVGDVAERIERWVQEDATISAAVGRSEKR